MPFYLYVIGASDNHAMVWVGCDGTPNPPAAGYSIEVLDASGATISQIPIPTPWTLVDGGFPINSSLYRTIVPVQGLLPDAEYRFRCGGAECRACTLPVPTRPKREPFTIRFSSCYDVNADLPPNTIDRCEQRLLREIGGFGLPEPRLNIFMGDQVYLDMPYHITGGLRNGIDCAQDFLDNKYRPTFLTHPHAGILRNRSSLFISDDHEFWNNYPYTALVGAIPSGLAADWTTAAKSLFESFQQNPVSSRPAASAVVDIGSTISIFTLDVRYHRQINQHFQGYQFAQPEDLRELERWIARTSRGLDVLVIGQPLFGGPAPSADKNIQNYQKQYEQLVRILDRSPRSMLIVSGDVHFARLAITRRKKQPVKKLVEFITSPAQLLAAGGLLIPTLQPQNTNIELNKYPFKPVSGVDQTYINVDTDRYGMRTFGSGYDNIATITFQDTGTEVVSDLVLWFRDLSKQPVRKTIRFPLG